MALLTDVSLNEYSWMIDPLAPRPFEDVSLGRCVLRLTLQICHPLLLVLFPVPLIPVFPFHLFIFSLPTFLFWFPLSRTHSVHFLSFFFPHLCDGCNIKSQPRQLMNWWSLAVWWNNHLFLIIWRSTVQTSAAAPLTLHRHTFSLSTCIPSLSFHYLNFLYLVSFPFPLFLLISSLFKYSFFIIFLLNAW